MNTPLTPMSASTARRNASDVSRTSIRGRQMAGLFTVMRPVVRALLHMVFTMRSKRMRGLWPLTVPWRRAMTENPSPPIWSTPRSPWSFEMP